MHVKLQLLRLAPCFHLGSKQMRLYSSKTATLAEFLPEKKKWCSETLGKLSTSLRFYPEIISEEEEMSIFKEVQPYLKRLVYEKQHWDEAIVNFRETEKKHWNKHNEPLIQRIRQMAFKDDSKILPYVHVLDLAEDGHIKPHIDSSRVRYTGQKFQYSNN